MAGRVFVQKVANDDGRGDFESRASNVSFAFMPPLHFSTMRSICICLWSYYSSNRPKRNRSIRRDKEGLV